MLADELVLVTSSPLLAELRRVLAYPKLAKAIPDGSRLVDFVEMASVVVEPLDAFAVVEDESDNRVLEAAVSAEVDYIVSGDEHLLTLRSFQGIPIPHASRVRQDRAVAVTTGSASRAAGSSARVIVR